MRKFDAALDWFFIITFIPALFIAWHSEDVAWLRFCTFLWLIQVFMEAVKCRIKREA